MSPRLGTYTADTMSVGRDQQSTFSGTRWEYVIFSGQGAVARGGNFHSYGAAKRAGMDVARAINEAFQSLTQPQETTTP